MHDVIVLYNQPSSPDAFDTHYQNTHVPLVHKLPKLREFCWGKTTDENAAFYVVARLSYATAEDAEESLASAQGRASVDDLANFAGAGVTVLNITRNG
jgi:uncharacterized protein (TIGR02118 family)